MGSKIKCKNKFNKVFSCVVLSLMFLIAGLSINGKLIFGDEAPLYIDENISYYKDKVLIDGSDVSITPVPVNLCEDNTGNPIIAYFYEDTANDIHTVIFDGEDSDSNEQIETFYDDTDYKNYIGNVTCGFCTNNFKPKYLIRAFLNSQLTKLDFSQMNNSLIESTTHMFENCLNITSVDTSFIDLSSSPNLEKIGDMFNGCTNLTYVDLDIFEDCDEISNANAIFSDCENLTDINYDFKFSSNLTDIGSMFHNCKRLSYVDLDIFENCNHLEVLESLFSGCWNLQRIDGMDTFFRSSMKEFQNMFYNCAKLKEISITCEDAITPTNIKDMFGHCKALEKLDISSFDLSSDSLLTKESSRSNGNMYLYQDDNTNLSSIKLPSNINDGLLNQTDTLLPSNGTWYAYHNGQKVGDTDYTNLISRTDNITYLKTINDEDPSIGLMYSESYTDGSGDHTRKYYKNRILDETDNVIINKESNPEAFYVLELTSNSNDARNKAYFYEDETNDIHTVIFEGSTPYKEIKLSKWNDVDFKDQFNEDYFTHMQKVKLAATSSEGFTPDMLNYYFYNLPNLKVVDFNTVITDDGTSPLRSFYKMFYRNTNLKVVDFGGKDLTVTAEKGLVGMFSYIPDILLNIGNIDVNDINGTSIYELFYGTRLETIDFTKFNFQKDIINATYALTQLRNSVKYINMSGMDLSHLTKTDNYNSMFTVEPDSGYNKGLEYIILPDAVPANEENKILLPKFDDGTVWAGFDNTDTCNNEVYDALPAKVDGSLVKIKRVDESTIPGRPGPEPAPTPSKKKKVVKEITSSDEITSITPTLKKNLSNCFEGYPDGSFKPSNKITRGEFAKVVSNFINEYSESDKELKQNIFRAVTFDDTDETLWSLKYIGFVSRCNLMNGDLNKFSSENYITRAEVVKVLSLLFDVKDQGYENKFTDELKDEWFEPYFDKFIKAGIVQGYDDGTLKPTGCITRIETIILINNLRGKDVNNVKNLEKKIDSLTKRFNDISKTDWFINDLVLAFEE